MQEFDSLHFRGANQLNLDGKGRFALPVKYRQLIADCCQNQLVITIDTQAPCLLLYPLPQWREIQTKLQALPSFNLQIRRLQRLIIGHACDVDVDKVGRLLLSAPLRDYAGVTKKMMLIGQGNKFELWDERRWLSLREQYLQDDPLQSIPEELQQISL